MDTETLLTADEFEQMPDDDSVRTELDQGVLLTMPPRGLQYGHVGATIGAILWNFVKPRHLGKAYMNTGFRLDGGTVRAPIVAFVRKERVVRSPGFVKGAPDLAVEIFLRSDSVPHLMRKVKQYLNAGSHTVWVVYPEKRQVHLWSNQNDRIIGSRDILDAPELLPGFSIPVAELFE